MFSNRWWCWGDGWWMGTTHCAACVLHCIIHGHCVLQLHCMVHGQPVRLGPGGRQHSPATSLGREVHHLYCNCWCWVVVTIHHSLATRSRALVSYGSTSTISVCTIVQHSRATAFERIREARWVLEVVLPAGGSCSNLDSNALYLWPTSSQSPPIQLLSHYYNPIFGPNAM